MATVVALEPCDNLGSKIHILDNPPRICYAWCKSVVLWFRSLAISRLSCLFLALEDSRLKVQKLSTAMIAKGSGHGQEVDVARDS